jgi:hypothetical protein
MEPFPSSMHPENLFDIFGIDFGLIWKHEREAN